jgi:iron complex transport system substrate-binding protein
VTIEHKYGEVTVPAAPTRVVSVGFSDHEWLLALGVTPVGVRDWYGDKPYATWEWAQDELGDAKPTVLSSAELNFEAIAALRPDLIVGVYSGMTSDDYAKLSKIAPTLAQSGDFIDYGMPWRATTEFIARAVGRVAQGEALVDRIEGLFADAREAHPEFKGATAAVSFYFDGKPGAYASQDGRSRVLTDLGFSIPARFDQLAGDQFFFSVSSEELPALDTDALVWIVGADDVLASIGALPLRPSTRAFKEGREVVLDATLSGAFSFGSPLSLEFLLAKLVPELALAVDGKPSTPVPSAAVLRPATPAASPATGEDAAAASEAFRLVFDSSVPFDAKSKHLAEPDVVRTAADAYTKAGSAMGGIALKPTSTTVSGTTATITYDVLFGGTAAYQNLSKTIDKVGDSWKVSTATFCGFLSSARVACP